VKIFYDTEFIDDGHRIDLVSIGMVAEDGREYYAVSSEFDMAKLAANQWLVDNVWPSLPKIHGEARQHVQTHGLLGGRRARHKVLRDLIDWQAPEVKRRTVIAMQVHDFLLRYDERELWAWYGAYDHVALAQLWGPMSRLPRGVPMWTNDLKQECARVGNPRVPQQPEGRHNALEDARHNKRIAQFLDEVAAR
jgi:hypothetical protein